MRLLQGRLAEAPGAAGRDAAARGRAGARPQTWTSRSTGSARTRPARWRARSPRRAAWTPSWPIGWRNDPTACRCSWRSWWRARTRTTEAACRPRCRARCSPGSTGSAAPATSPRSPPCSDAASPSGCSPRRPSSRSDRLAEALRRLTAAGILEDRTSIDGRRYEFRHALIRDAAYESLLRKSRLELHRRVASIVEGQFPERFASEPELVGHHLALGGEPRRAAEFFEAAGRRAAGAAALAEAAAHYRRGIELLGGRRGGHRARPARDVAPDPAGQRADGAPGLRRRRPATGVEQGDRAGRAGRRRRRADGGAQRPRGSGGRRREPRPGDRARPPAARDRGRDGIALRPPARPRDGGSRALLPRRRAGGARALHGVARQLPARRLQGRHLRRRPRPGDLRQGHELLDPLVAGPPRRGVARDPRDRGGGRAPGVVPQPGDGAPLPGDGPSAPPRARGRARPGAAQRRVRRDARLPVLGGRGAGHGRHGARQAGRPGRARRGRARAGPAQRRRQPLRHLERPRDARRGAPRRRQHRRGRSAPWTPRWTSRASSASPSGTPS